jgi:glutaredoxin 3
VLRPYVRQLLLPSRELYNAAHHAFEEHTSVAKASPEIEIYTTPFCPYCRRAKALLEHKGVGYREIDVSTTPAIRDAMAERAGGARTVPQIFVDGQHIGDSDRLLSLEEQGALDAILRLGG